MARLVKPGDADATLIARLRRNLALMYALVLAGTLVLAGVALYFSLRLSMLRGAVVDLQEDATFLAQPWTTGSIKQGVGTFGDNCQPLRSTTPSPGRFPPPVLATEYIACFDRQGDLLGRTRQPAGVQHPLDEVPPTFLQTQLIAGTLAHGKAWDVVDAGPGVGLILRAATFIPESESDGPLAVLQVGRPMPEPLRSLDLIRNLMLAVGGLAFAVTSGAGWLLARRALAPAQAAMKRQRAFISDASHELRAPLALLRANADVLLRERDQFQPEHAAMIEDIITETEHLAHLTTDLLTLASLDVGPPALDREPVDVVEVAEALTHRVSALAAAKGVAIEAAGSPGAVTLGDRHYLEQAGLVLLENAVKYTASGGRVVIETARGTGTVSLIVRDSGIGIPAEQLRHLGERFYRGDQSRTRHTGGSGLGLAIAFGIARRHGGSVHIESEVGKGTRAVLELPSVT